MSAELTNRRLEAIILTMEEGMPGPPGVALADITAAIDWAKMALARSVLVDIEKFCRGLHVGFAVFDHAFIRDKDGVCLVFIIQDTNVVPKTPLPQLVFQVAMSPISLSCIIDGRVSLKLISEHVHRAVTARFGDRGRP